jgi:hypothetical protein
MDMAKLLVGLLIIALSRRVSSVSAVLSTQLRVLLGPSENRPDCLLSILKKQLQIALPPNWRLSAPALNVCSAAATMPPHP